MQIFVVDENPILAAQQLCDQHVVKQPLEGTQILSTVSSYYFNVSTQYKPSHPHRLCVKWASQTLANWQWLVDHTAELFKQWHLRYNHPDWDQHKSEKVFNDVIKFGGRPKSGSLTPFVFDVNPLISYYYTRSNVVESFRAYYRGEKTFATWKYPATTPDWFLSK